jgi:hypothetical protein
LRKEKVEQWEAMQDLDVGHNFVFIDESGFNLHIQRNFGRSLKVLQRQAPCQLEGMPR